MLRNKSRNSPAGCQPLTGAGQRGFGGRSGVLGLTQTGGFWVYWSLRELRVSQAPRGGTGSPSSSEIFPISPE